MEITQAVSTFFYSVSLVALLFAVGELYKSFRD